jgi:hypothetical protein
LGIHDYDHLPVMFLNLPPQAGTTQYSYRAMLSTSPANYQDALSAIDSPVLTLVGSLDEAFDATTFPEAMETLKKGQVQIVEGQTHNGIRHSDMAMLHITQWAKKYALVGQEE